MTETTRAKSPKKPADHLPKSSETMVGKFKGEEFTIFKDVFEDYEFLELSGEVDENPAKLPKLLTLILGVDGHERLKDAVRNDVGRVRTEDLMAAYQAVMEDAGAKNS